jgi:hypothetical protein
LANLAGKRRKPNPSAGRAPQWDAGFLGTRRQALWLAGCGQGEDAGTLDAKERARLRGQALNWLRADLESWHKLLDKEADRARALIQETMRHWQQDVDFAGVRGAEALGRLPEPERRPWQQLWDEVETLARRTAQPKK